MSDANIWLPGADIPTAKAIGLLYKGTSVTPITIADTGTLTFYTQLELYFGAGDWVLFVDQADNANWMSGQVVSYDTATGILVFTPSVKHGSGLKSSWYLYLSGVWIDKVWIGGTATDPVILNNTLVANALVTVNANLVVNGAISSTAGNVNLKSVTALADANAALTAAQLFAGEFTITPTANRTLTLPTAASIIAYMTGYAVGSNIDFTIVNNSNFIVTLAGNTGVVQTGVQVVSGGSGNWTAVINSPTIVEVINNSAADSSTALTKTMQVFTSSGTYTPSAGTTFIEVHMVGGGAGGITAAAGNYGGAGGGAGEYAAGVFGQVDFGSSQVITIPAAAAVDTNGGTVSFGALLTAAGGTKGTSVYQGGIGGTGGTGTGLHSKGGQGENGSFANAAPQMFGGHGGASFFGGGGRGGSGPVDGGAAGSAYGSGGGGNGYLASFGSAGAGAKGVVVIYEYK